jgi:hypothetical protein
VSFAGGQKQEVEGLLKALLLGIDMFQIMG